MTEHDDAYRDFAKTYDLGRDIIDINEQEQQFYKRLFAEHGIERILDCACGTGRHCYLFTKMGYDVEGSDISEHMLAQAHRNFDRTGVGTKLTQCDFRQLDTHFDKKFDAVVCLTTSLPHLHKDEELIRALTSMKSVLRDKGIVVIDQGTTHSSLQPDKRFEVVIDNKEFSRVFIKDIKNQLQTIHILDIFHGARETRLEHHKVVYRILLDRDYQKLLEKAGYNNIRIMGDLDMTPYDAEKSRRLVVVGEK
jgi:ubiquinone/menaquinone biosynthesis C-methylase UbiE